MCSAILILIFLKYRHDIGLNSEILAFIKMIFSTGAMLLLDIIWNLWKYGAIPLTREMNMLLNAAYISLSGVITYYGYIFVQIKTQSKIRKNKKYRLIISIPMIIVILLSVSSIETGGVFYINDNNEYCRGKLFIVIIIMSFFYIIYSGVIAFLSAYREKNKFKKKDKLILGAFVMLPSVAFACQTFLPDIPIAYPCITLSLLFEFMNIQESHIYNDTLTGLNNRRRADEYLETLLMGKLNNHKIYLFLIDVDKFKSINDRYGHIEGDCALKTVAFALKVTCSRYNAFLSRFGGDEFEIVWKADNRYDVDDVINDINRQLEKLCTQQDKKYELSLSVGYTIISSNNTTIEQLRCKADKMLYSIKKCKSKKIT